MGRGRKEGRREEQEERLLAIVTRHMYTPLHVSARLHTYYGQDVGKLVKEPLTHPPSGVGMDWADAFYYTELRNATSEPAL